ncbi:MAG: 1-(5-phosphoribosyl)-5-[(5-phosphoribosylamino)methylideneamino]imidazole-4-carboxamide isomerase [Candidatus Omnitrophica bacterium]|nr:1-(5-phosphoribosyl)-5-[(5-phosphoribosylamino)methylideneamino]imidazole-4-carboxamide isomerase [Candidatus Omnitrophota bacterium]MDD5591820.1 1-(5-phosphoribosyl)-5-[(5-phosphoribosylamino)methylideneamino]imidazole-4-carboxamide isomerase [Candidatus Omnitrophota bacterium]
MLIIPAIDLKDGCVVRYTQGRFDKKVYSRDPLKTARHWQKQGARLIHIVDLDGAISGKPKNLDIVKKIVKEIDVPVQFGGGVRNEIIIKTLLDCGIWRIILGTKAVEDKGFLEKSFKKFKDKIIVSLDAKANRVLAKGWQSNSASVDILKLACRLKQIGFKQVIYTDILKDGTLKGPNIKGIKSIIKETGLGVIASGGISSLADISKLRLLDKKELVGVIIGKALYEGKFTLAEAIKIL